MIGCISSMKDWSGPTRCKGPSFAVKQHLSLIFFFINMAIRLDYLMLIGIQAFRPMPMIQLPWFHSILPQCCLTRNRNKVIGFLSRRKNLAFKPRFSSDLILGIWATTAAEHLWNPWHGDTRYQVVDLHLGGCCGAGHSGLASGCVTRHVAWQIVGPKENQRVAAGAVQTSAGWFSAGFWLVKPIAYTRSLSA